MWWNSQTGASCNAWGTNYTYVTGGSYGNSGGNGGGSGQGRTTCEFNQGSTSGCNSGVAAYGGSGSGANNEIGGAGGLGGGAIGGVNGNGSNAVPNRGGGGGGTGGLGGSGVVVIRNKR